MIWRLLAGSRQYVCCGMELQSLVGESLTRVSQGVPLLDQELMMGMPLGSQASCRGSLV